MFFRVTAKTGFQVEREARFTKINIKMKHGQVGKEDGF